MELAKIKVYCWCCAWHPRLRGNFFVVVVVPVVHDVHDIRNAHVGLVALVVVDVVSLYAHYFFVSVVGNDNVVLVVTVVVHLYDCFCFC